MKNKKLKKRTKFHKDTHKQYIKKIRIYPPFCYGRLDKWLKSMSLKGWHIVHCGLFSFVFEKGEPKEKEYFTYGLISQEGKYSVSLRYPLLEKTYGLKKKKSKINSNESKSHQIVEIDLNKTDIEKDVGYKEMISDRNRLYFRHFIKNLCVTLFFIVLGVILYFIST